MGLFENAKPNTNDGMIHMFVIYIQSLNFLFESNVPRTVRTRHNLLLEIFNDFSLARQTDFDVNIHKAIAVLKEQYPDKEINKNVITFLLNFPHYEDPLKILNDVIYMPNYIRAFNYSVEYQLNSINSSKKESTKLKKLDSLLDELNIANIELASYKTNVPDLIIYVESEILKLK